MLLEHSHATHSHIGYSPMAEQSGWDRLSVPQRQKYYLALSGSLLACVLDAVAAVTPRIAFVFLFLSWLVAQG